MLRNKNIGLFITGGIASYKMAELSRQLIKKGANVRVVMSKAATEFITPLTLQTLTKSEVLVDTFEEKDAKVVQHVEMADWCDFVVVAPATANVLAKMAIGLADDIISTTLLATHCPRLIVPAMNSNMYQNPATQRNIEQLKVDGHEVMVPGIGFLAEGYEGIGRLPELNQIVSVLERMIAKHTLPQLLKDKKVMVSAGGTKERIDPVRYISNDSSGKMGYAVAEAAVNLGAEVTLVSTINNLPVPIGVQFISVTSAQELFDIMVSTFNEQDIAVMTAAVSDYRLAEIADQKIKKQANHQGLVLNLIENPDILAHLGANKSDQQLVVGFAAETHNVIEFAKSKLNKKQADWIVANDVSRKDAGFSSDHNQVTMIGTEGKVIEIPYGTKNEIAYKIWEIIMGSQNED